MANLATQNIVDAGTAPTLGAASTSDTAEVGNGHNTFVVYKNAAAGSKTVTIAVPGNTEYGKPNPPADTTIPAGAERWIPLRKAYDQSDGTGRCVIAVTPDATSLTVAVVRLG